VLIGLVYVALWIRRTFFMAGVAVPLDRGASADTGAGATR